MKRKSHMNELPQRLRELRKLANVTIERAAKSAGVSFGTLWNFEHGKAIPTQEQISTLEGLYVAEIKGRQNRSQQLIEVRT